MGLEDDILPDTKLDRERTTTGKWALGVGLLMFIFIILGFTTPSWMEADPRFYGTKFEKLGLWVHCFRSLPDFNDLSHQRFYAGCRWIFNPFTEGYPEIRSYIVPRKCLWIFLFLNAAGNNIVFLEKVRVSDQDWISNLGVSLDPDPHFYPNPMFFNRVFNVKILVFGKIMPWTWIHEYFKARIRICNFFTNWMRMK
jgi:hypothetical protein